MSSESNIETDIIIELLEVFINSILFARQLYPAGIFRQRRAYNIPVWISIFKPLNDYLGRTLRAARELQRQRRLRQVELVVLKDESDACLESYVFEIEDHAYSLETDENLFDLEEQIRKSLLNLDCRLKNLKKLPSEATFKIMLHTTESAFVKLCNDPKMQGFPLVKQSFQDLTSEAHEANTQLLPISHTSNVGLQIYVKQFL